MDSKLSYVSAPLVGSYMYEALPDRLRYLAEEDGAREAFVFYDHDWQRTAITRQGLLEKTISLAKVLVRHGLRPKTAVGCCMTNSMNMLVANMAVVCAGGIPFYMGTNLKDGSDIIHVLNRMKCELFIIDANVGDSNWSILENIWPTGSPQSDSVTSLKLVICNGNVPAGTKNRETLASLMSEIPDDDTKLPHIQPEDTLAYFCTSGTTGEPKEVTCTHFSILNWTKQSNHEFEITKNSRFFCDRTFSWVVGFPRTYLAEGSTRVLVDPRMSSSGKYTENIASVIEKEKCDVAFIPNYIAVDLLNNQHLSGKFKNLRTCIFGGERYSNTYTVFKDKFCQRICSFYGTTEAGGASNFQCDEINAYEDGVIGKPISGMEIKLIDNSGSTVPQGTMGELCTRSAWRFGGYHDNDAIFRKSVDNSNWFHTGDMARIREDGNMIAEGRQREIISTQTIKLFPWSIEQTLKKMPGVLRAFAIGVPDKRSYEVVCACVIPQKDCTITPDDIRRYCDEVFLEESSSIVVTSKPRYHVVLDFVPLTRSGKTNRMQLAAIAKEKLGL